MVQELFWGKHAFDPNLVPKGPLFTFLGSGRAKNDNHELTVSQKYYFDEMKSECQYWIINSNRAANTACWHHEWLH